MRVVFRADASQCIGTGHIMRCKVLAESLIQRGADVHFVCRQTDENLLRVLYSAAISVKLLFGELPKVAKDGDYESWLGLPQEQDAEQTIQVLGDDHPDWLIVDHYSLDHTWESLLRPHVGNIVVIDDLANRTHDCDVLLDQNFSSVADSRYTRLVPSSCQQLLGPKYALLRPEYRQWRICKSEHKRNIRRVFVFFGGIDEEGATLKVVQAMLHEDFQHWQVDIVVGQNNPHREELNKLMQQHSRMTLHGFRPHLADLLARADLAIGAGGVNTWERMCLGVPSVVSSIAENQLSACESLSERGLIEYLGSLSEWGADSLRNCLLALDRDSNKRRELSLQSQLQVDGLGTARVTEALLPTSEDRLRLRVASIQDRELFFHWINDPETRRQALQTVPVSWADYCEWFAYHLADPNTFLFVLEAEGLPVGQIQFQHQDSNYFVDYLFDSLVMGRGWGKRLVRLGMTRLHRVIGPASLRAEVRSGNKPSHNVFETLNFTSETVAKKREGSLSLAILSDASSWINDYIVEMVINWLEHGHAVQWVHNPEDLTDGDLVFFLGCSHIVPRSIRKKFQHCLVVHESDLPKGKGWSPLTWQILEGANRIPVTLIEAEDKVDSGVIYLQEWLCFEGHELLDELRAALGCASISLCQKFVRHYLDMSITEKKQEGKETWYPRRRPSDSCIDLEATFAEQFNLLRVVDNNKYPAYINYSGHRYKLLINKLEENWYSDYEQKK